MTLYNIYYGTIGKTLGVKYRFTKSFKSEEDAKKLAKKSAQSFYLKNEGKHGIPSFNQINEESKITGLDIEVLYDEHIHDMMRYYIIPTSDDSIPTDKLKSF
jgi:hypothetical protein